MNKSLKPLFFEIATAQLIKHGEELCGDTIITSKSKEVTNCILSDGLGSGVKANILSTLTANIISVMLKNECRIDDAVETIMETLPTCQIRQLAYSTFSLGQFYTNGHCHLVEYDNPPVIFLRNDKLHDIDYNIHKIKGKLIKEVELKIQDGDIFVFMSDGEVHAGIGGMWNLGWGWDRIVEFTERIAAKGMNSESIAFELTNVANELYAEKPGDDTSVIVVKARRKRLLTVFVGAPKDKSRDSEIVESFMSREGEKIICGGTTGNIVSRYLKKEIEVDLTTITDGIPPIGKLPEITLCTEGIITISNALKKLQSNPTYRSLKRKRDGVSLLIKELLEADEITFMVGQAMNSAHQTANMPAEFGLKTQIMEKISELLIEKNKIVSIEYY